MILILQLRRTEALERGSDLPKVTKQVSAGEAIHTQAVRFQSLHLRISLNCMNKPNDNFLLRCSVLHEVPETTGHPQYPFSPCSFGNRSPEYQRGTWLPRLRTTFPSLPYNQVGPCDSVLANEI